MVRYTPNPATFGQLISDIQNNNILNNYNGTFSILNATSQEPELIDMQDAYVISYAIKNQHKFNNATTWTQLEEAESILPDTVYIGRYVTLNNKTVNMNQTSIINMIEPNNDQDAVNKIYVDNLNSDTIELLKDVIDSNNTVLNNNITNEVTRAQNSEQSLRDALDYVYMFLFNTDSSNPPST